MSICPIGQIHIPNCACVPCTTALIRRHAPHLLESSARSPQPVASTPPLSRGAGSNAGPGLRAPFHPTDQDGPGRVATPRVPGSSAPPPAFLEPGEATYGPGWPD